MSRDLPKPTSKELRAAAPDDPIYDLGIVIGGTARIAPRSDHALDDAFEANARDLDALFDEDEDEDEDEREGEGEGEDEDDLMEHVLEDGALVGYQDWDSGGPGAGAGTVGVYRYVDRYFVTHDAGMDGPYDTFDEAARGIYAMNEATIEIWTEREGIVWTRRNRKA